MHANDLVYKLRTKSKKEGIEFEISCINFLTKNNFDFNTLLKDGIDYLSRNEFIELKSLKENNPEYKNIDLDIGFSKIIEEIISSKNTIIAHNMSLDLAHILNQFICSSLPETLENYMDMSREILVC